MMDSFKPKPILNKSELKQIRKSRTRIQGKKVITDDVIKLKSLKVMPDLPDSEKIYYYKEPIWIEYYIPKESRFAQEIKFLFIKLIDAVPRTGKDIIIEKAFLSDSFIDILSLINEYPEYTDLLKKSYQKFLPMLETISDNVKQFAVTGDCEFLKVPVYLTETMILFEPTLATLEFLGEYTIYNLNWLIKRLNIGNINFSLEDRTICILIKRRNDYWDEQKLPIDEDFDIMAALFFEQAYPHRGALELDESDFLLD